MYQFVYGSCKINFTCSSYVGHHLSTIEGGTVSTDDYELYNMLKINPNQKFYISADVPKTELQYFYDNYDCFTWDVLDESKYKVKQKYRTLHKHTFANVVDLMMLSNTSYLLKVLSFLRKGTKS